MLRIARVDKRLPSIRRGCYTAQGAESRKASCLRLCTRSNSGHGRDQEGERRTGIKVADKYALGGAKELRLAALGKMNPESVQAAHLFVGQQFEYVERTRQFDVLRFLGRESLDGTM